ncbi:MAG: hypothetical protein ACFFFT_19265 [Candidatus Thorarchaeota archaeon]
MTKKGKFQLLSYLVDEYLIYYKSLNKKKKLIAFAMFETVNVHPIISFLNNLLIKRYIKYYTIQLNMLEHIKYTFILNFEEVKRENILKTFNDVFQKVVEENNTLKFFKNSKLEKKFLEPIIRNVNSKVSIMKNGESLLLLNNKKSFLFDFYSIDFDLLENKDSFVNNFIKIINNFEREGYLIFNFKIDNNDEIEIYPYFVEIIIKKDDLFDIEKTINTFFNNNVLKRQNIKIRQIFNYLWRLGISSEHFPLKYLNSSFTKENQNGLTKLFKFNKEFEQNLLNNQIEYIRLSKNLIFIEEKFLILVLIKLDSEYIRKIIEKYHSKYCIYITILIKEELEKLVNISNFKSLNNIQILSSNEIIDLDFSIFRNNT